MWCSFTRSAIVCDARQNNSRTTTKQGLISRATKWLRKHWSCPACDPNRWRKKKRNWHELVNGEKLPKVNNMSSCLGLLLPPAPHLASQSAGVYMDSCLSLTYRTKANVTKQFQNAQNHVCSLVYTAMTETALSALRQPFHF